MQFTRKHSDCNDGTCPALWDTDDPDLIGVQGTAPPSASRWPPGVQIPGDEQVVLVPRALLESYLRGDL